MTDIENRPWQQQEKSNGADVEKPWPQKEPEVITKPEGLVPTQGPTEEQHEFFQEHQFDKKLGKGTDPIAYYSGRLPDYKPRTAPKYGNEVKKDRYRKAEKELKGHPNKAAILKILRSE